MGHIGRRLLNLEQPPQTLAALRHEVEVAWQEVPQDDINHLIRSMPRRINECVMAHQPIIKEILRKWPPAIGTDRVCTKSYTIPSQLPDEEPLAIEKEVMISIPVLGLHRDPVYYPNPEKFDPERFNGENTIEEYAYIPFGCGPRKCIASRFALVELKALLFKFILHFEILPGKKLQLPIELDKKSFNLLIKGGFWFILKKSTP